MALLPMIRTPYERLRDEIDRTFDRWLTRAPETGEEGALAPVFGSLEMPRIELEEDEKEIRVQAELPGLDKDDFKVELTGQHLLIHGEKKAEREEKKRNYHLSELSYGSFSRTIALPCEVEEAKVKATYKNGILSLTLPKTEQSQAKRIDVKIAA